MVTYLLSGFSSIREALIKDKPLGVDYDELKNVIRMQDENHR
jgi:hypothetical protein